MDLSARNNPVYEDQPSKTKSLEQLVAKKTIKTLEDGENGLQTLLALENEQQQVLLPHIWHEVQRLRKIENAYNTAIENTPVADRRVYFRTASEDIIPIFQNEYDVPIPNSNRLDHFQTIWNSGRYDAYAPRILFHSTSLHWENWDFIQTSDIDTPIGLPKDLTTGPRVGPHLDMSLLISSQLLYYRLAGVFGQFEGQKRRGWKECWALRLDCSHHPPDHDQKHPSALFFGDYVGRPEVSFYGNERDSASAIDLLNWIVSDEVPHCYLSRVLLSGRRASQATLAAAEEFW